MALFTDQTGGRIDIEHRPRRIVSLVPSQTELLFHLGLQEEVVGITKFCVHPEHWFKTKARVGGTKELNVDLIRSLQPDLIIANKEENVKHQVEDLKTSSAVWVSDVSTLDDALNMIESLGDITGTQAKALSLISIINERFRQLQACLPRQVAVLSAAYLVWRNPYMAAGGDTFINEMMKLCGLQNVFRTVPRYPVFQPEDLRLLNCDVVLLPSEPFPFGMKHVEELQPHLPGSTIILVDGEFFSWYGSRLAEAPAYFQEVVEQIKALK